MKIDFEFQTIHGMYRDALHLPDDHTFTDEEIQAMKQARVDLWVDSFSALPVEEVVVVADDVPLYEGNNHG